MFQNKTVVITGAAQGIGRSVATHFAKAGANVVIADVEHNLGVHRQGSFKQKGIPPFL